MLPLSQATTQNALGVIIYHTFDNVYNIVASWLLEDEAALRAHMPRRQVIQQNSSGCDDSQEQCIIDHNPITLKPTLSYQHKCQIMYLIKVSTLQCPTQKVIRQSRIADFAPGHNALFASRAKLCHIWRGLRLRDVSQQEGGNADRGGAEVLKLHPSLHCLLLTDIPQP